MTQKKTDTHYLELFVQVAFWSFYSNGTRENNSAGFFVNVVRSTLFTNRPSV